MYSNKYNYDIIFFQGPLVYLVRAVDRPSNRPTVPTDMLFLLELQKNRALKKFGSLDLRPLALPFLRLDCRISSLQPKILIVSLVTAKLYFCMKFYRNKKAKLT